MDNLVFLLQKLSVSLFIIFGALDIVVRVFEREHRRFLKQSGAYDMYSVRERVFYILQRGRSVPKFILVFALWALYAGAEFLTDDIRYASMLYYQLTQ